MPHSQPQFVVQIPSRYASETTTTTPTPQQAPSVAEVTIPHTQQSSKQLETNEIVAIDISDFSIELLLMGEGVFAYGRRVLEQGVVLDGNILKPKQLEQSLFSLIQDVFPDGTNCPTQAILSIPESQTYFHQFFIPHSVTDEELKKKIRSELTGMVPQSIDDIYIDQVTHSTGDTKHVLCIAVPRVVVDTYCSVFEAVGIHPVIIDSEALSLSRALLPEGDQMHMIIDIGARATTLAVCAKGHVQFAIYLPVGGEHITQVIADAKGSSLAEAEAYKRTHGMSSHADEGVVRALEETLKLVVEEIPQALEHYHTYAQESLTSIILAGGTSLMPGLSSHLQQCCSIETCVGNPLVHLASDSSIEESPIMYANVIGLGLRASTNREEGINLATHYARAHPQASSAETYLITVLRFFRTMWKAVLVGIALILVIFLAILLMG